MSATVEVLLQIARIIQLNEVTSFYGCNIYWVTFTHYIINLRTDHTSLCNKLIFSISLMRQTEINYAVSFFFLSFSTSLFAFRTLTSHEFTDLLSCRWNFILLKMIWNFTVPGMSWRLSIQLFCSLTYHFLVVQISIQISCKGYAKQFLI